jgi:hypothetical protein
MQSAPSPRLRIQARSAHRSAGQIERRNRLIGRCRSMALRTGPHPRETLSINAPKMHLKLALLREAASARVKTFPGRGLGIEWQGLKPAAPSASA